MTEPVIPVEIPNKPAFKPAEVCEFVQIPSYVLRTWENEFRDLGLTSKPGAPRSYRRRDVALAFRIKALVFEEHLTLAGVRRRLEQEHLLTAVEDAEDVAVAPGPAAPATETPAPVKERIALVKEELRSLLQTLARDAVRSASPVAAPAAPKAAPRAARRNEPVTGVAPALPGLGDEVEGGRRDVPPAAGGTEPAEGGRRRRSGGATSAPRGLQ